MKGMVVMNKQELLQLIHETVEEDEEDKIKPGQDKLPLSDIINQKDRSSKKKDSNNNHNKRKKRLDIYIYFDNDTTASLRASLLSYLNHHPSNVRFQFRELQMEKLSTSAPSNSEKNGNQCVEGNDCTASNPPSQKHK